MGDFNQKEQEEIFSKSVRAGKRTYFFDVRSTKRGELFLTITESKKMMDDQGNFHYQKHKIFLYQEDFEKFSEGLNESLDFIVNSDTKPNNDNENQEFISEEDKSENKDLY